MPLRNTRRSSWPDFNGDGRDELLARNDQGLTIWWFDAAWDSGGRQVNGNATPQSLNDFRWPDRARGWLRTRTNRSTTRRSNRARQRRRAGADPRALRQRNSICSTSSPGRTSRRRRRQMVPDQQRRPVQRRRRLERPVAVLDHPHSRAWFHGVTNLVGRSRTGLVPVEVQLERVRLVAAAGAEQCRNAERFRTAIPGYRRASGSSVRRRPAGAPRRSSAAHRRPGRDATVPDASGGGGWREPLIAGFQPFGESASPAAWTAGSRARSTAWVQSPSYYETFGTDDLNGDGVDELFARASDGLRVRSYDRDSRRRTTTRAV